MSGPWEKYQAQSSGPWEKYATQGNNRPAGLPEGVNMPGVEAHPATQMEEAPQSFGGTYLKRLGDTASGLLKPIIHPSTILTEAGWADPGASPDLISDIRENPNSKGMANALADITSAGIIGGAMHAAPSILGPLGEGMKSSGAKLIDRTAGLLKSDVSRGAEPGRAYLEGGGGPVMSLKGLAESAKNIKNETGSKLGQAYKDADARGVNIPAIDVFNAVQEPITKLRNLQRSPGGVGSPASLTDFEDNLNAPIYAASARGGFTPSELFTEMKQPISQNTRWNDPTMYDLNKVRQETVGKIGDILTGAVPETATLNKIFQGTNKLAGRAAARAETGQSPLTAIGRRAVEGAAGAALGMATHNPLLGAVPIIADSVPVRTATAKGLFEGGRIAPIVGESLRGIAPLSTSAIRGGSIKQNSESKKDKKK